ncbi:MAG TPA: hypothetical protein VGC56_08655 [Allosphingosinicella sp.]|jgi:hypothetical protein
MLTLILATMLAPSAEAETLGRRLAATGALETLLPMIAAKETEEVIGQHPELTEADRKSLRATTDEVVRTMVGRLSIVMGHEYAVALSMDDLRALVEFADSPEARRYRAAIPGVTMRGLGKLGNVDFKGELAKAFCAKSGKLCPPKG